MSIHRRWAVGVEKRKNTWTSTLCMPLSCVSRVKILAVVDVGVVAAWMVFLLKGLALRAEEIIAQ